MVKAKPKFMRFFASSTCTSPVFPAGYYLFYYLYSSDQYGPCVGVTRIERWERASALGLNPPQEVSSMVVVSESYLTPTVGLRYSIYQTGCNRIAIRRKRFSWPSLSHCFRRTAIYSSHVHKYILLFLVFLHSSWDRFLQLLLYSSLLWQHDC